MRRPIAFMLASVAAAALIVPAEGLPREPRRDQRISTVVSQDRDGVVITLQAPVPAWREGTGYVYPSLEGFGLLAEPGRPALPVRILRVGIPAGTEPRLTILDARSSEARPGLVGPVQRWVPVLPGDDQRVPITWEDPAVYGADALYPAAEPVRLGTAGSLREASFVELVFTPILHDPLGRRSVAYSRVTVRVDFGVGGARSAPLRGGSASRAEAADAAFGALYEQGLVNASQAMGFLGTIPAGAGSGAPSREGSSTLTPIGTRYKMIVNRTGIYRLSRSWAQSNAANLVNRPVSSLRIECQGVQIPITVVDANSDGTFNGSDVVEFYGQALTWDVLTPDDWNAGDFTDDNVYWIRADTDAGLRAEVLPGAPTDVHPIPADFLETVHHEVNEIFVQQVPEDPIEHWFQDMVLASGAFGSAASAVYSVATPGASASAASAAIKVRLLGDNYVNNYHRTSIKVNGVLVSGPTSWDGFREFTHGVDDGPAIFPQSVLNDGTPDSTYVTLTLPFDRTDHTVTADLVDQNWIEIAYRRLFKAGTDDALTFSVPNQSAQIKVTGLSATQTVVYEITRTLPGNPLASPVRVTGARPGGAGPFHVEFEVLTDPMLPPGTMRRFVVSAITASGSSGDLLPAAIRARPAPYLRTPATGADWLVVYKASLVDTSSPSWTALKARRQSQGLRVVTVDVEDVYDEFSYGIEDPEGIRDFFAYAYTSWPRVDPAVPLTYGILVGDASHDYKNHFGHSQSKNLLSTYMRSVSESSTLGYMSDESYFAAVSGPPGDPTPDFFLGRWPVHTIAETNAIADKILAYETQSIAAPRPAWQYDVVFVADDDEQVFESVQDRQAADYLSTTPTLANGAYTHHRTYERQIELANPGWSTAQVAAETRDRIIRQLNGTMDASRDIGPGAAVLSYVGHGAWQDWGSNSSFFKVASSGPDDLTPVANASRLPLLIVANCITGAFAATAPVAASDLTSTFGEAFLVRASKGGIGVIAPSHLTTVNAHDTMLDTFFDMAFGATKLRGLGALSAGIQLEFGERGDHVNLRSYTLFADPAVSVILPSQVRPEGVSATPGNREVTVSWTPAPGAASYNVYQATHPSGPYARVCAGATGTSCVVTDLSNCTAHYFIATAVDGEGFESAYSHFNSGCAAGGPCVTATPATPAAPSAPTGVTATDAETGGAVRIDWDASPPSDEVLEHTVYWGTSPGLYSSSQTAGPAESWLVTGLTDGIPYYFAVSASNCSHGEGLAAAAAPVVPHRIEGIKPPNGIDDLRILREPDPGDQIDDTRLEWTPPTTNIYGQPTTLDRQEIYAGTTPTFPADAAHRIGTVAGTAGVFVHEDSLAAPARLYYLVVAFDAEQNRSGVSRELPRGIDALMLTRAGGSLNFQWPAVTSDLDGRPTVVSGYVLYGRSTPFRRSQLAPALIVAEGLTGTDLTIAQPAGSLFFYSVIAVDNQGSRSPW